MVIELASEENFQAGKVWNFSKRIKYNWKSSSQELVHITYTAASWWLTKLSKEKKVNKWQIE